VFRIGARQAASHLKSSEPSCFDQTPIPPGSSVNGTIGKKLSRMLLSVKVDVVTGKTGPMESQFVVWQMIPVATQRVVSSY
jgi:hypothetical protein